MTNDFAIEGVLARAITGFNPRESQQKMAQAVREAIKAKQQLVVEAGTGTGKTFAYLVPALRAKCKIIISTGSKALQDQLYGRDLPTIVQAIDFKGQLALLKGRSNYLCLERLAQQLLVGNQQTDNLLKDLAYLRRWSSTTEDGDINTCVKIAEDSLIWPLVTSTHDNCLGADCPKYQDCFVVKARRRAMDADIVVINHHLFMADRVVKESGFAELIPCADAVIFDEAHQIPDIASQYFGQQLTSRQLMNLAKDIIVIYRTELQDTSQLQTSADQLIKYIQDLRSAFGSLTPQSHFLGNFRGDLTDLLQKNLRRTAPLQQALGLLEEALVFCHDTVKSSLGRSTTLDTLYERVMLYLNRFKRLKEVTISGFSYWYECSPRHFILALTPLSIAERFRELMIEKPSSWIFTSATLSVNEGFEHFTQRLGLTESKTLLLPSPFDYANQALLCVPRHLPSPNQFDVAQKLVDMLKPVIEANHGGCFFLCTSNQMMRELAEAFRASMTLPVLVQGETSKEALLNQFITAGNALLVATNSFWEGVDVRGNTLSCVIIDKLPFTTPDDPLLKARMEDCRLRGGNPFNDVQLPDAIIMLKQGVGRLIRDISDRGLLVICDHRLVTRPYGAIFLNSLPPTPRTRDLTTAIEFVKPQRL
ncbi:ATP-dependent DNA helicase [Candidatus Regiella endosymbiont of Tuberolachnus salignus]|uniref:ATP-dependent DNA helicase n=1 Tax=Candidatus Regiella endosymbiont of Tuberolachnus salignus TaxID=3077956 RepID=UPI0030D5EE49